MCVSHGSVPEHIAEKEEEREGADINKGQDGKRGA